MRLDDLLGAHLRGLRQPPGPQAAGLEITALAYDSRAVTRGALFFCVTGLRADGHEFAADAVRAGAGALVVERPLGLGVPEVLVDSAREAMAPLAARFYRHPDRELDVVGITGTNGKTTTAYMVRALLEGTGTQCGLLGTVKSVIGGREQEVSRTTPEAIDLQGDLRAMLDGGDRACAIEVSSHALSLGRTDGVRFAAAVFTNMTRDHLDFHEDMEDYFRAKRLLFMPESGPAPRVSVLNAGDPYGRRLAQEVPGAITFALDAPADYSASGVRAGFDGCRFTLDAPHGRRELSLPMLGRFNVANALGALATAVALGGDPDELLDVLSRGVHVPGRFEPVDEGQDFAVLVDYAHTPDSLENVLGAARELIDREAGGTARLICVFGAGGDRDRGKRPLMGEIGARLADLVFVTSDNPRSEDPDAIIAEIMAGAAGHTGVVALADRREASAQAVASAGPGDVLVVAGKGHEQGQEFTGGRKIPFDDVAVAREALAALQDRPVGAGAA